MDVTIFGYYLKYHQKQLYNQNSLQYPIYLLQLLDPFLQLSIAPEISLLILFQFQVDQVASFLRIFNNKWVLPQNEGPTIKVRLNSIIFSFMVLLFTSISFISFRSFVSWLSSFIFFYIVLIMFFLICFNK